MRAAAAALLLLAAPAHAHLVIVCTSSDPAKPGELTFYLGTYHSTTCGGGGSVPGTMHVQGGSGTVQTASFNDADCAANNPPFASNPTGATYVSSLTQTWGLPANAVTQCYTRPGSSNGNTYQGVVRTNADGSSVYDAAVLGSSEASVSAECYPTSSALQSWYRVVATNAQSGTFEVWTTGTNADLNPGSGAGNPCTMAGETNTHVQMALTVVTGGQACQPFTGSITGATVGADCAAPAGGTVPAGVVCTIPCNQIAAGELKCDAGNWVNTYSCVANTCSSSASSTFTGQAGVAAPCTFTTAEGDSCTPSCTGADVPVPAGATVVCQADGTWSGSGHCGAAVVTACNDGLMNGDETGVDCGGSCPPCTGGAVVSGDPFTKYGGKTTQFYLPLGKEHTLLTCPTVELRGRTKHSGVPGDTQQWFDRFTVLTGPPAGHRNTVTVGLVGAMSTGSTTTARNGRVIAALQQVRRPAQLALLNLTVDGVAAAGGAVSQLSGGWKVEAKHNGHAEVVALSAGDVKVRLQSAIAQKFAAAEDLQHMHIDVEFDGLDVKACAGVFPEIWGVVPMSNSTERLLTP